MSTFETKVRDRVESHLETLLANPTDPSIFRSVLNSLTKMAILGTAPPSCNASQLSDDFSSSKESWIAR